MKVRHARQAAAVSIWLLALAAQSAAETNVPAETSAAAEAKAPSASQRTAEARTHDVTDAERPSSATELPRLSSETSWERFDGSQRLELMMVPNSPIGWSAADGAQPGADRGRGNMQRYIGYLVGGLGVVGLATGGVFGYRAFDFNQRALDQCRAADGSACTSDGKDSRDQAKAFAGSAMISLAAGAALLVSGIALIVHAPHAEPSRPPLVSDLRLTAVPSLKGANVRLVGAW
jgi:hypothetical protein